MLSLLHISEAAVQFEHPITHIRGSSAISNTITHNLRWWGNSGLTHNPRQQCHFGYPNTLSEAVGVSGHPITHYLQQKYNFDHYNTLSEAAVQFQTLTHNPRQWGNCGPPKTHNLRQWGNSGPPKTHNLRQWGNSGPPITCNPRKSTVPQISQFLIYKLLSYINSNV